MAFPLNGVKVLEVEGIGPAPLGCCVLADFGADVYTVSRVAKGKIQSQNDPVSRGKMSLGLDLKSPAAVKAVRDMVKSVDVFVEPFRPGVMEKLGLGPEVLCADNPRLIYARMTGWGQSGDPAYVNAAGHDSNYIALAGALDLFRRGDERPMPPANFAGDYAGGGMMLAMGVLLAIIERATSGKGQVIDVAMTDGANYVALPLYKWLQPGGLLRTTPSGRLDPTLSALHHGPPFCNTYECKCGGWVAVQAIEPQFYAVLIEKMGLSEDPGLPKQGDESSWKWMRARYEAIFLTKTRDEWEQIFRGTDACVAPVLSAIEAAQHPHNVARGAYQPTPELPGAFEPAPAPKLSRTPGHNPRPRPKSGAHTSASLLALGLSQENVDTLLKDGVAVERVAKAKL